MKRVRLGRFHLPRMSGWLITIGGLAIVVAIKAPQNLWIVPYKLLLVTLAAWVAHRLDHTFFEDKTPAVAGESKDDLREISRALVFLAVVLGLTLGV